MTLRIILYLSQGELTTPAFSTADPTLHNNVPNQTRQLQNSPFTITSSLSHSSITQPWLITIWSGTNWTHVMERCVLNYARYQHVVWHPVHACDKDLCCVCLHWPQQSTPLHCTSMWSDTQRKPLVRTCTLRVYTGHTINIIVTLGTWRSTEFLVISYERCRYL